MITTSTVLTLSLAKAAGIYFIVAGLTGFIARERWGAVLDNFRAKAGLTYLAGVFVFVLGTTIILVHNIWTDPLAGFISLVGWVAAIEGLVLIAIPGPLLNFSQSLMRPAFITGFAGFAVVLGAVLLFAGLTGTAG